MSDRPLFATSMRRFGVYFHGYNKHYKEDVRKYLFWINSLGGSVVPKIDSHKKKVNACQVTTKMPIQCFYQGVSTMSLGNTSHDIIQMSLLSCFR